MQVLQSRLRLQGIKNQLKTAVEGDQNYDYYTMKLQLKSDFVNNLMFFNDRYLIIVLESGVLIVFDVINNEALSVIRTDLWVSSVFVLGSEIWSVGKQRKLMVQHQITGKVRFSHQLNSDQEGYHEAGVVMRRTHKNKFMALNAGFFSLKIVAAHTKKVLRFIRLETFINTLESEEGMFPALKEYYTSTISSVLYFVTNIKGSYYLNIFNYRNLKVLQEICVFPVIDISVHRVFGYHLLVSNDEFIILVLFQLSNRQTRSRVTYVTILTKNPRTLDYNLRRTFKLSMVTDIIICKNFFDNEVRCKDTKPFALANLEGSTQSLLVNIHTLEITQIDNIQKAKEMLTAHIIAKNLSITSSQGGEIIIFDTVDICKKRFKDLIPLPKDKLIKLGKNVRCEDSA